MPTTTYTPTATWSNTSSRQANGDVSDETIISAPGRAALDNIAYLTGSNTRTQVSRIQTCTDLTALKAIGSSDRRDLDFCVLDTANGERLYKFDSGSSSTGDDYAVVTPASGTGRWHLVGAKPKSTSKRWVSAGYQAVQLDTSGAVARDVSTGHARVTYPANATLYHQFGAGDFNAGDIISSVEAVIQNGSGNTTVTTVYHLRSAAAGTAPTVTTLATLNGTGVVANITSSAAPLPITMETGDQITAVTVFDTSGGSGGTTCTVVWVGLAGTRTAITE